MNVKKTTGTLLLGAMLVLPLSGFAQEDGYTYHETAHERAVRIQHEHDAQHHTKAKIVGGSAAGGAVLGAVAGGPKGAVVGGAVGAGAGLVANHIRKEHDIHKRTKRIEEDR